MQYTYPCILTPEPEAGGFSVSFPDVPEALTCGDCRTEALEKAEDALAVALSFYVDGRRDIPVPSDVVAGQELVAIPSVVAAKLALYTAMRRQGVTQVDLGRRLGKSQSAVARLLDLRHRSHIGQVEAALRAVGRVLVVGDRAFTPAPASPQPAR